MSFDYEFGGPLNVIVITFLLPVIVLLLSHWADIGHLDLSPLNEFAIFKRDWKKAILNSSVFCPSCQNTDLLLKCALAILGWFLFQVILERVLPCELVQGSPIHGEPKNRLVYRINGHLSFWVTWMVVLIGWPFYHEESQTIQFGSFPIELLYQYYNELALVTILLSFFLTTYLYCDSFVGTKVLAKGGNSGNMFYDFFIGRELNPRIGTFDWKEFCELRPGLVGWMLLNAGCLKQQYLDLGYVTGSMILLNVFQGIYVWDAQYQERAILTTMDITTDGFGFMLVFGDLCWVPFTYSLQAHYLVKHDPHLSYSALAIILALHVVGYSIFRGANGQKDAFRRNPDDPKLAHLSFLQTKRGTKLLTSGWWGMARKINYTGDWIMGLTWCLVCGFESLVPYYYAVYFLILLLHRSMRDDEMCKRKYGEDWDTYKSIVPYRFVPGIL